MEKWQSAPVGNNVHVLPIGDTDIHYDTDKCPCKPRVEVETYGAVIIHNAFDGRGTGSSAKNCVN